MMMVLPYIALGSRLNSTASGWVQWEVLVNMVMNLGFTKSKEVLNHLSEYQLLEDCAACGSILQSVLGGSGHLEGGY
jgi:hypothetical protein